VEAFWMLASVQMQLWISKYNFWDPYLLSFPEIGVLQGAFSWLSQKLIILFWFVLSFKSRASGILGSTLAIELYLQA
jgi:hypothetical protein